MWGLGNAWAKLVVDEAEIRAAFDQVRANPEVHQQFAFCVFIDGFDKFNAKEMGHWKLSKMLHDWAHGTDGAGPLKLYISSREDHSIMSAFQPAGGYECRK